MSSSSGEGFYGARYSQYAWMLKEEMKASTETYKRIEALQKGMSDADDLVRVALERGDNEAVRRGEALKELIQNEKRPLFALLNAQLDNIERLRAGVARETWGF